MSYKLVTSLVLAFISFLFIVQNAKAVQVRFLLWSAEISQVLLMVLMLIAGFVIGWLLNGYLRLRKR